MKKSVDYININKNLWDGKVDLHLKSDFYDQESFIEGKSSLKEIELALLGEVKGKSILHLQCHFGQDSMSLSRMGAKVTGVDFSENAIFKAQEIAKNLSLDTQFVCSDIYELPEKLNKKYDIIFTSYGTIGWLPDIDKWGSVVSKFLKSGGEFVFAEFHPFVWSFDEHFQFIKYRYFKSDPIVEMEEGTYAEPDADYYAMAVSWNHSLSSVITALIKNGLRIDQFKEYDYSPYNCFTNMVEEEVGKFRIKNIGNKLPMVYSLLASKV